MRGRSPRNNMISRGFLLLSGKDSYMRLEDYEVLNQFLQEFREEAAQTDVLIEHNTRSLREADACLKSLTDSESEDIRVFSPRKAEVVYKEEIQKIKSRRTVLEEKGRDLNHKKAALENKMKKLEDVLKNQRNDFSSHVELEKDTYEKALKDIRLLAKKMEASCAQMERNPIQARQDLLIALKRLGETADKMEKLV